MSRYAFERIDLTTLLLAIHHVASESERECDKRQSARVNLSFVRSYIVYPDI